MRHLMQKSLYFHQIHLEKFPLDERNFWVGWVLHKVWQQ